VAAVPITGAAQEVARYAHTVCRLLGRAERHRNTGRKARGSINGFSLHANTQVPAHRRDQLERLIRYTARGAVSLERLSEEASGDLLYTFTRPWSDGTTGIKLSPVELLEKLAALVPLPRGHLVRYGGCLAPHSKLRSTVIPTPRQQGVEEPAARPKAPHWGWARLLKRVFALDMGICPFCHRGALRIIAAITQGEVIRKILRHLKLSADPPPIAPARSRQERFDWVAELVGDVACPPVRWAVHPTGSHRRAWPWGRRACSSGVSRERTTPLRVCKPV
jgi:Putative transposase